MPKQQNMFPPQNPVRQIVGWCLGTIVVIALAYACYSILGIFFGR